MALYFPGEIGQQVRMAKRIVSVVLGDLGIKCPKKEVEAIRNGERVEAFFSCASGMPGTLSFYQGREQWMPELEEEIADWQD